MASKPFIAARIPEGLNLKLDEHSKATGESRTQALINSLAAYLGYTSETPSEQGASDRLSSLEKRVQEIERLIKEPRQISLLETHPAITQETTPLEIKVDNRTDQKPNSDVINSVIKLDNTIDYIQPKESRNSKQKELIDQSQQDRGKFLKRMKTQDIPTLPGLEDEDPKKIKTKLNNTKHTKTQATRVGDYAIVLVPLTGTSSKNKRQELLWDVYEAKI